MKINSNKVSRGFTLMELLIVIAIIGILSVIVMAVMSSGKDKSNDAKVLSQLGQMNSQAFLYNGATGPAYAFIIGNVAQTTPYQVSNGITGATPGGTQASGTLFNNSTNASNSLYLLASKLPGSTYVYYGWNGIDANATGKWFFAASTSTGAFCTDWSGEKKSFYGIPPSNSVSSFTSIYPNATVVGGYKCN